ncbi:MAG: DUF2520 domain-containing protein [Bacteroidota bacterium]
MSERRIAVIGTGNVATHLIRWFTEAKLMVTSVYTRNPSSHQGFGVKLRDSLDYRGESCDFIVIATKDDVIGEISKSLSNTGKAIIVHTSGSVPLSALKKTHFAGTGVLYPLQTLQKGRKMSLANVPFLIEGDHSSSLDHMSALCKAAGFNHQAASTQERLSYHLSAVISSNFTNHLLYFAEKFLNDQQLNAGLLRPLMHETVQKAFDMGAFNSQTGPARRADQQTIQRHQALLKDPELKALYEMISASILSTYQS